MSLSTQDVMDEFAARAMQAILADPEVFSAATKKLPEAIRDPAALDALAQVSYDIAIAMMTERGKRRRLASEFSFNPNTGPIV